MSVLPEISPHKEQRVARDARTGKRQSPKLSPAGCRLRPNRSMRLWRPATGLTERHDRDSGVFDHTDNAARLRSGCHDDACLGQCGRADSHGRPEHAVNQIEVPASAKMIARVGR
jgi:hypothetical protein